MRYLISRQVTGAIYIYLVVSGYAMRDENLNFRAGDLDDEADGEALQHASAPPSPPRARPTLGHGSYADHEDTSVESPILPLSGDNSYKKTNFDKFLERLDKFASAPSMKALGSGSYVFWDYMRAKKEDKDLIKAKLSLGIREYAEAGNTLTEAYSEDMEAAMLLETGMAKWITNQQTKANKPKQRADYAGCKFDLQALLDFTGAKDKLSASDLVKYAEMAFQKEKAGGTCKIIEHVRSFASSSLAKQLLGVEEDSEDQDVAETNEQAEDASPGPAGLLELSGQAATDEQVVGIIIGCIVGFIILVCIARSLSSKGGGGDSYASRQDESRMNQWVDANRGNFQSRIGAKHAYYNEGARRYANGPIVTPNYVSHYQYRPRY